MCEFVCVHSQEKDGRLVDRLWSVGDQVKIEEAFEVGNKSINTGLVGRVIQFVFTSASRIAKGDRVFLMTDAAKIGTVETDDGSSNPYKVRWADGTLSGWLKLTDLGRGALVDFGGDIGQVMLAKQHLDPQSQLDPQSCASATKLQETVRKARLTRIEVVVLILYTGPLFLVCAPPPL